MPFDHHFALEGTAVSVVEDPLLCQEMGLLLGLGVLHVLLVLGQTLLLLLLRCAVVLAHLLRKEQRNQCWPAAFLFELRLGPFGRTAGQ